MSDTYTISPTIINEFRVGFNRRKTTKSPDASNQDWAQQLGIPGVSGASFPFFVQSGSPLLPVIPSVSNTATYYRTGPGGHADARYTRELRPTGRAPHARPTLRPDGP